MSKKMVLVLSQKQTRALRSTLNNVLELYEATANKDAVQTSKLALSLAAHIEWEDFESFYKAFQDAVHEADMCEDPNCKRK